jgi:beta-galactosidase/beta-glucuronidase
MGVLHGIEKLFWPFAEIEVAEKSAQPLSKVWKFKWDPEDQGLKDGWADREYDDKAWDSIRTDTAWEQQPIGEAWNRAHGQDYDGLAWYRTSFTIKPSDRRRKVFLIFGAVDEACVIWVNGRKVLHRPFPYEGNKNSWREPFTVEITKYVGGGENSLAVRVEDREGHGGIWKPVWLSVMDEDK